MSPHGQPDQDPVERLIAQLPPDLYNSRRELVTAVDVRAAIRELGAHPPGTPLDDPECWWQITLHALFFAGLDMTAWVRNAAPAAAAAEVEREVRGMPPSEPSAPVETAPPPTSASTTSAAPKLSAKHRAEFDASAVNEDIIRRAKVFSCGDPRWLAKAGIGSVKGWTPEYLPALVFPYPELGKPSPILYAAKPQKPIPTKARKGREPEVAKYIRTRKKLYPYLPPNIIDQPELLDDPQIAALLTEGEKKALSAASHGFVCIGIAGVHTWGANPDKDPGNPKPRMDGWGSSDHSGYKRPFPPIARAARSGKDIYVVFDSDAEDNLITVRPAEDDVARVCTRLGATVYIIRLPSGADDTKVGLDDFLKKHGAAGLHRLMREARESGPACTADEAEYLRRPEVLVTKNWKLTRDQSMKALHGRPGLYQRGGVLVRVTRELSTQKLVAVPAGAPRIALLPKSLLGVELTDAANLVKISGEKTKPADPPTWLLDSILQAGEWREFPQIAAVIERPVIRADGSLVVDPGLDAQTGLFLEALGTCTAVHEQPSAQDVALARAALEEVIADFPFKDKTHRAGWVALAVTLVARFSFDGPTPMFLFDASTAGSGKTLLALIAALIATGREPWKGQFSGDESEQRKLITSLAIAGARCILFDNIIGEIGGGPICDLLTATHWGDRILGVSLSYSGPWLGVVAATGNNVRLGPDMHRRVVHVRLESEEERPEERTSFAHPDLLDWVRTEHARLHAALLTLLRGYHAAGRPSVKLAPWGSYEAWSAAVRAPLVWAGFEDPALSRTELIEHAAVADRAKARLVEGWLLLGECTAGEALKTVFPNVEFDDFSTPRNPHPALREAIEELLPGFHRANPSTLGQLLASCRSRNFGEHTLVSRDSNRGTLWRASKIAQKPQNGSPRETE